MRLTSLFVVLFLAGVVQAAPINNLTDEQKLSDLTELVSIIKSGYGPLEYKKTKLGIDVDVLAKQYSSEMTKTKSNAEFYYSISRFIAEFHDGHFRGNVPTDLSASVPFNTDLYEGKVLITDIDRTYLPESKFPFQKGDEILSVDGTPIEQALDTLQAYRGLGNPMAERRLAAMEITFRSGRRLPVPSGSVVFQIRHGVSAFSELATLKWRTKGTSLDENLSSVRTHMFRAPNIFANAARRFDDISTFAIFEDFDQPRIERSFQCSGLSRIERPKDATVILESPFVAYYYPTAKGNIGYLRIPHYSPEDGNYALRFQQYEYAVSILEKNTVGLIIDQDHNCGGSVEYMHQIMSLFLDKAVAPMQFQLRANKAEILRYQAELKEVGDSTLASLNIERVLDLVKATWLKGDYLTPKIAIDGTELVEPNTVRYTKPIVMLIDEMSGSGGDAFPSMMGGIGRAKLLGHRTMGLGGHVVAHPPLFYSQITAEMTKSLFYRPDGVAVENNGAVPDAGYEYDTTRDDMMYGYRGYRAFYEAKLLALIE